MPDDPDLPPVSAVTAPRPTLARVSLWTGDPDRLESFYGGLFGFRRVAVATLGPEAPGAAIVAAWKLPPHAAIRLAMLRSPRGDTELAIASVTGWPMLSTHSPEDGPPMAGMAYLVLYVPDLDAVVRGCHALGLPFQRAAKRVAAPDGTRYHEMAVHDPDGRVVLVVEDVAPA